MKLLEYNHKLYYSCIHNNGLERQATKKVEEELKLSLIRDIMKLTDKQLEYILNNLKGETDNAFAT